MNYAATGTGWKKNNTSSILNLKFDYLVLGYYVKVWPVTHSIMFPNKFPHIQSSFLIVVVVSGAKVKTYPLLKKKTKQKVKT